jgi:hypothetical protein
VGIQVGFGRQGGFQNGMRFFGAGFGRNQPQATGGAMDVGIDRKGGHIQGEQQYNRGSFKADAFHLGQPGPRLVNRHGFEKIKGQFALGSTDEGQGRFDARRFLFGEAGHPNGRFNVGHPAVANRFPGAEARFQLLEGPVPVEIGRTLAEDGADQFVDGTKSGSPIDRTEMFQ